LIIELEQIMRLAGLSISGAFKRGLLLLRDDLDQKARRTPEGAKQANNYRSRNQSFT
jgi:hypothetical protein